MGRLVDELLATRAALRANIGVVDGPAKGEPPAKLGEAEVAALREKLHGLQTQLAELQGEQPLILPTVDYQAVASVVEDWTGIPVGRMARNEIETVLKLADTLGQRVIGQDHAMRMIAKRIQTSRAGLDNPNKPIGVFMLAGTSGVGKTETALALAEALYGGEQNLITINMSEYQEAHTVSSLKGAPPGYVGYGEGGVLTEAVRRNPYSVVLLDEVEKAHPDVLELFFQVFDKGVLDDAEGREIDERAPAEILDEQGAVGVGELGERGDREERPHDDLSGLQGQWPHHLRLPLSTPGRRRLATRLIRPCGRICTS